MQFWEKSQNCKFVLRNSEIFFFLILSVAEMGFHINLLLQNIKKLYLLPYKSKWFTVQI